MLICRQCLCQDDQLDLAFATADQIARILERPESFPLDEAQSAGHQALG